MENLLCAHAYIVLFFLKLSKSHHVYFFRLNYKFGPYGLKKEPCPYSFKISDLVFMVW